MCIYDDYIYIYTHANTPILRSHQRHCQDVSDSKSVGWWWKDIVAPVHVAAKLGDAWPWSEIFLTDQRRRHTKPYTGHLNEYQGDIQRCGPFYSGIYLL